MCDHRKDSESSSAILVVSLLIPLMVQNLINRGVILKSSIMAIIVVRLLLTADK